MPTTLAHVFHRRLALALALVGVASLPAPALAQPTELLLSEYIEGTGVNKAIEIFNGTGATIDLGAGGYSLLFYFNGSTSIGTTIALSGTVADGDVHVVADDGATAAILAQADQTSPAGFFSGNDAVVLRRGASVIDSLGQIGDDPGGSGWVGGGLSTANRTLRKKASVCTGDTDPDNAFDPAVDWTGFPVDTFAGLGAHSVACGMPPAAAEIFAIQGTGATSPMVGQTVVTQGNVVTGVGDQGFCMQTPDVRDDGDDDTSNGIYVFTDSAPTVTVGDLVDVTAQVEEFFDMTQLSGVSQVTVVGVSALPATITFDTATPSPDPSMPSCGLEYECYEGMRVRVATGTVTGPSQSFNSDPIAEAQVVAGEVRPFRETGVAFPGLGGAIPTWDGNPEVFELDPDGLGLANQTINAGGAFDATGCLGFTFGDYVLWATSLSLSPPTLPVAVPAAAADEATIGTLNLFRLFDDIDDPGVPDTVVSTVEYQRRLTKFSRYVRDVLGSPDLLAVQEVEKLGVLTDLATVIASDDPSVTYVGYLVEGNDQGGIDVGLMARSDRATVDAVTQLGAAELLTFDGSLLHDRPPLLVEARLGTTEGSAGGLAVALLVNHTRSLSGIDDPSDGPRVRQKRLEQAQSIAQKVQDFQTAEPTTPLIVLGDLNAYEFTDGYVDLVGQIRGVVDPSANLLSGPDLVDPDLTNTIDALPPGERYSFVFNGSAQALDHILISSAATPLVRDFAFGRGNADAARILIEDDTTPLRASDHDGAVLFLALETSIFTDGFESSDTSAWTFAVP